MGAPEPSHENHGQLFYRQILEVPRLSGTADRLPLLVRQMQLPLLKEGTSLRVEGQLRSFNNRSGPGRRLVLTVYARSLQPGLGEPVNRILLAGTLCKPPIYRRTPLGRSISDLILAVPRSYGRADYLPVIAWGQVASQVCTGHKYRVTVATNDGLEQLTVMSQGALRMSADNLREEIERLSRLEYENYLASQKR